jgi:hypothetical protein
MKKHITITNKNIKEGELANPENCAIARSLKDSIRNLKTVSVLADHIKIGLKNGKSYSAEMPKEGTNFIKRFDRGQAVNKFKLDLNFV